MFFILFVLLTSLSFSFVSAKQVDITKAVDAAYEMCYSQEPHVNEKGVKRLRQLAKQSPYALGALGVLYENGIGAIPVDQEKALKMYRAASRKGDGYSDLKLARLYFYGDCGQAAHYGIAKKYAEQAVKKRVAAGYYYLGLISLNGDSLIEANHAQARRYFQKGDELGDLDCKIQLGCMLINGEGGACDKQKGIQLLKLSTKRGSIDAMMILSSYYKGLNTEEGNKKVLFYYEKAAAANSYKALYSLGAVYEYGRYGVVRDMEKALNYYTHSYELGYTRAATAVAEFYEKGMGGLSVNKYKARELYEWAASYGDSVGLTRLADYYLKGWGGLEKSGYKARRLTETAAKTGFSLAQSWLGYFYFYGIGGSCSESEARIWFEHAAEQDSPSALYALAIMSYNGFGGMRASEENARKLLKRSASLGHEDAQYMLHSPSDTWSSFKI